MKNKCHKLFIYCSIIFLSGTNFSFAKSFDKNCEKSEHLLLEKIVGTNYQQDENIVFIKSKRSKYFWVLDKNPSKNPTRFLLKKEKNEKTCVLLSAKNANEINFNMLSGDRLPNKVTTKTAYENDIGAQKITYSLDKNEIYHMSQCETIKPDRSVEKIECEKVFNQ